MSKKKDKKIIYPSSLEVSDYLNDGKGICNKCGALMDETIKGGIGVYICPACGWEEDVMDYEYEESDDMMLVTDERGNEFLIPRMDEAPPGCRACGGPYPHCKPECNEYDD